MANVNVDVKARFDDLDRKAAAAEAAANEAKTAANSLGAAMNDLPASFASSDLFKNAMKESMARSDIGSGISDAKEAAKAAEAAAKAAKEAAEGVVGSNELRALVKEAVKDQLDAVVDELRQQIRAATVLTNPQADLRLKLDEISDDLSELKKSLSGNSEMTFASMLLSDQDKTDLRQVSQNPTLLGILDAHSKSKG